jgi:hypothetical protein
MTTESWKETNKGRERDGYRDRERERERAGENRIK